MNIKMKSLTIKKCFVLLLLILSSNISVAQDCLDSESYYQYIKEEFYKLKYCSTVVYMVPRA